MAAKKRQTLPKDFREIIQSGDVGAWEAMYETCEIEAYYDRVKKFNALSYEGISPEFIRWAVGRGMDPNKEDEALGQFPIERQAHNLENVAALIEAGADLNKKSKLGRTVLENIFWYGHGLKVETVKLLLAAGAKARRSSIKSGLHREEDILDDCGEYEGPEWVKAETENLAGLYELFGMQPDEERRAKRKAAQAEREAQRSKPRHDGVSPIRVKATRWEKQFDELWDLLVPKQGKATTVQGEVIRIVGRVIGEIVGNGACNWSRGTKSCRRHCPAT